MPIIYVSTFFVGLIIYMAIFLILMKVRADLLAALMDNIEKNYPFFYSENRPSMSRFGGRRMFFPDFHESGYVAFNVMGFRAFLPIIRSEECNSEYRALKKDPIFRKYRRVIVWQMISLLLLFIIWAFFGMEYVLNALA